MTPRRPARTTIHRTRVRRRRVAGLAAVVVIAAALGDQVLATSSSSAPSPVRLPDAEHRPPRNEPRVLGVADGAVPDGTTVFDDAVPGVARLDRDLLDALRRAAAEAAGGGLTLHVDSGWRSTDYQQHLLDEAIAKHGSEAQAARWVARPDRSAHVSGDAVDIGPSAAAAWLSERGAAYGLCQTYANEPWHYELRPEAPAQGCPPMYDDPTHDRRMQP